MLISFHKTEKQLNYKKRKEDEISKEYRVYLIFL